MRPRYIALALFADGSDLPLFAGVPVPVVQDAPSLPPAPEPAPIAAWDWVGPLIEEEE